MKILQVNAVNGIGSTGRTVLELAAGLEALGIESRVAHSAGPRSHGSYIIGGSAEKKLHALQSRISGKQAYFSHRGTKALIRYLASEAPDVVHLRNLHGNFINLPMLLEFLAVNDVPTVLTLHDCWFFTGKCSHYSVESCLRWQSHCGSCPRLRKDNPSWFIDATTALLADKKRLFEAIPRLAVVGVSDWITQEARRSILANASEITRIYNWVDMKVFRPVDSGDLRQELGLAEEFVVLGVASRWTYDKGLAEFLHLASVLEDDSIRIVLVGEVGNRASLPENVIAVGAVSDTQALARYYSLAGVLLQLSQAEAFGKVVAESLACGTPVIAYDSTANSELICEGCGYTVQYEAVSGLTRHIDVVRQNTEAHYTDRCREFAELRFDMTALIDDYVTLYQSLCNMTVKG